MQSAGLMSSCLLEGVLPFPLVMPPFPKVRKGRYSTFRFTKTGGGQKKSGHFDGRPRILSFLRGGHGAGAALLH